MINSYACSFFSSRFSVLHFVSFISISPFYLVLLHLCLYVYLSVHLSLSFSLYLSISLSLTSDTFFYTSVSVYQIIIHYFYLTQWDFFVLSVLVRSLPISLSFSLSVCLSVSQSLSLYLSISLSIYLSFYLSIYLSTLIFSLFYVPLLYFMNIFIANVLIAFKSVF